MKPSPLFSASPLVILAALGLGACTASIGGNPIGPEQDGSETGDEEEDDLGDLGTPGACPGGEAAFATLMAKVKGEVDKVQAPGVAIAIVCGGKLAHTATVGSTKVGGESLNADTRFQLASATKMFTAAAAARLDSQGIVDLDAPISTYIAGLSFGQITLRDLLSHSAGFPTVFDSYQGTTLGGIVTANSTMPLWAQPGQIWNYSNTGYLVAGAVLEAATGRSFPDIIEDEVFAPADMQSATMDSNVVNVGGNFAYGHEGSAASAKTYAPLESYYHTVDYGPMGGAWGSVTDLARWAETHMATADPLGNGVMQSLRQRHFRTGSTGQGYGLGHFVEDSDPAMVHHSGSVTGFLTDFAVYPEKGFAVAVISNSDWLYPGTISDLATDAYLGEIQLPQGQEPATVAQVVGTYNDPAVFGTVVVREGNQGLEIQFVDKGITSALIPWWGDSYGADFGAEGEIDINFWREAGQNASHIVSLYGVAKR